MIHELIEQKKKSQRASSSRNTKPFQEPKNYSQPLHDTKVANLEASDSENKEGDSSSSVFIPPWLRNSLGLNQRNNLSNGTATSESKSSKLVQRGKEHNELDSLKNIEQDCRKKAANFEILPQEDFRDVGTNQNTVDAEDLRNASDRGIPIYWDLRRRESDSASSCGNLESQCVKKNDSKRFSGDDMVKNKIEEKRKLKFFKPKGRVRKHVSPDPKQLDLGKNEIDFLLEIKAREAFDNYAKGNTCSVSSDAKHREPKFVFLGAKSPNNADLNKEDYRMLRDFKNVGGMEEFDKVFEHVKDGNFRETKTADLSPKNLSEKEKEDKIAKGLIRKCIQEGNCKAEKDSLLSTDDENDIKRFSEFLSKNKNLDEKRKCLEEVRNYFERKRRTRLTKRSILEEDKVKLSPRSDRKEDQLREKQKSREFYRERRSRLALNEEAVEKAVDETLHKFVELYHFRVSPTSLGTMKKNILQAIKTDALEGNGPKLNESKISTFESRKSNLEEPEKSPVVAYAERDTSESPKKEGRVYKDVKKKHNRAESFGESSTKPGESSDNEKLKRLRKDFDNFLHSVQGRFDFSNLKLQSVVLEKEDKTSKGIQLVYNFAKKILEPEKEEPRLQCKEGSEPKTRTDSEIQTPPEQRISKKSIKIQTVGTKSCCEQSLQTEDKEVSTQDTQTDGVTVREISELKSHEVSTGLYRMVRSKEVGKFYLYPEDNGKSDVRKSNKDFEARRKKSKKGLENITPKERKIIAKEKERHRLKKVKRGLSWKNPNVKNLKKKKAPGSSEDSINCLYFRNFKKKGSESLSSKRELTDENRVSEERVRDPKEDHMGCFWFWNGQKIAPGCDLKTHVENIVKEKLTEMTHFEGQQTDLVNSLSSPKNEPEPLCDASQKNVDIRTVNTLFCYNDLKRHGRDVTAMENNNHEERKKVEGKRKENGDVIETGTSQEKEVKNVGIQNSESLSLSLLKLTAQPKSKNAVKRKCTRRNIIIKPAPGKAVTLKKAEDIIRAVEEIQKMKLGFPKPKNDSVTETEFMLEDSTSTVGSNRNTLEDPVSVVLGIQNIPETEDISNGDFKTNLEKLINLVDREVQTAAPYDRKDLCSVGDEMSGQIENRQKHLQLIESVLGRVNQKERESLWNDVRDFIKTKIGRDINDEGAREVCIEIEQDVPKSDQGNMTQSVLARGHYSKNEGDVEVEIDLTLDDLAKILRQRQRKFRRRNLCRSSKSKSLLSSSSVQSDFTKDDLRRYEKYLQRFATAEGDFLPNKELRVFQKNKGN